MADGLAGITGLGGVKCILSSKGIIDFSVLSIFNSLNFAWKDAEDNSYT